MGRESPPVRMRGEVLGAVVQCLRVADPGVEERGGGAGEGENEWVRLWRRCQRVAEAEREIAGGVD